MVYGLGSRVWGLGILERSARQEQVGVSMVYGVWFIVLLRLEGKNMLVRLGLVACNIDPQTANSELGIRNSYPFRFHAKREHQVWFRLDNLEGFKDFNVNVKARIWP